MTRQNWPNADEFDAMSQAERWQVQQDASAEANQAAHDCGMTPPYPED